MKIDKHDLDGKVYWTVLVEEGELVVESGKKLPYSTWIGVIRLDGKIEVWTPAASVPRGYRKAAKALLEQAREHLQVRGLLPLTYKLNQP